MRKLLLSTCGLSLLALAPPAFAQEAAGARASAGNVVGEVVVTAERRTQSVQKSSLAIQVLSPETLANAGVSQLRDLTSVNPGVNIGQGGPATQIYIRGVGDFGSTPQFNPAVATYIDGVYVARANAIEGNMYDLQRVEVLKGPQGTLYGRNAAGGALNILTNPAELGKLGGGLNVELGDYSEVNVDGFVNVPIGDTLAIRGAFQSVSRNGYSSMGFDDDHHQGYRINGTWKPNDDMQIKVGWAYSHVGGIGPGYNLAPNQDPRVVSALSSLGITMPSSRRLSSTDPRVAQVIEGLDALATFGLAPFNTMNPVPYCLPAAVFAGGQRAGQSAPLPGGPATYCNLIASRLGIPNPNFLLTEDPTYWQKAAHVNNNYWNLNTEFTWKTPVGTLTIIPGYRQVHNDYTTFPTLAYLNGHVKPEQSISKSFEVRLAKDTSLVDWTVGAYAFQERQSTYTGNNVGDYYGDLLIASYGPVNFLTSNVATFAQGTWHVTDQLRLITGIRYSQEWKAVDGATVNVYPNLQFANPTRLDCLNSPDGKCLQNAFGGKIGFTSTNWKLGAEYDLTPVNMLFATASTGFKAGGLNAVDVPGTGFTLVTSGPGLSHGRDTVLPYNPEKLTAFEVGSRNRFMDGSLQANFEGFYWKYKGHQDLVAATIVTPNGNQSVGGTQNVGNATIYGGNFDIVYRLTPNDTVRAAVEYLHTNYDSFSFALANTVQGLTVGCPTTPTPTGTQLLNCAGNPLTRSPEWSGSVGYTHTFELSNGGTVDAAISGQFATKSYTIPYYNPIDIAPAYFKTDVNVTYRAPSGNWTFQVWGRNITNADIITGSYQNIGLHPTFLVQNIQAPRTFGVRMGVKF